MSLSQQREFRQNQYDAYKTFDLRPAGPKLMRSIEGKETVAMVDKRLLDLLVCPACHTKVAAEGEHLVCQNAACGLRFPVRDDIPIMLIQAAEKREQGTGNREPEK